MKGTRAATDGEHIPPAPVSLVPLNVGRKRDAASSLLDDLSKALFPYSLSKYPGRVSAISSALGLSVGSFARLSKPCGEPLRSAPLLLRAEKLARDQAQRLLVLADRLKAEAASKPPVQKRRGFLEVAVREPGGMPRNAQGWHNGGKKLKPF